MVDLPLEGYRILLMEDEALIAMDVEQLCRDSGAAEVTIVRNIAHVDAVREQPFHAAIVDLMLGGSPTTEFARHLQARRIPFVFATGYTDRETIFGEFPGVRIVGKPYLGTDLVDALAAAVAASDGSGDS